MCSLCLCTKCFHVDNFNVPIYADKDFDSIKDKYEAVTWLRRLVAGLSQRRPGFDTRSVHVRFVVDEVALGLVFLRVVGFPLSISFHWCSINCKTW
jgi:hypothetical protein